MVDGDTDVGDGNGVEDVDVAVRAAAVAAALAANFAISVEFIVTTFGAIAALLVDQRVELVPPSVEGRREKNQIIYPAPTAPPPTSPSPPLQNEGKRNGKL